MNDMLCMMTTSDDAFKMNVNILVGAGHFYESVQQHIIVIYQYQHLVLFQRDDVYACQLGLLGFC